MTVDQLLELFRGNIAALGDNPLALYVGIGLLMFANSSIMVPPSEYVCIAIGVLAANDRLDIFPAVILASSANMVGTFPWYILGKAHKIKRITLARDTKSVGSGLWPRIVHAYTGSLAKIEKLFVRHGVVVLIIFRNVPVLRSIVSYPAGRAGMSLWQFVGASSVGILAWVTMWSCLGLVLGALAHLYKWYLTAAVGILSLLILKLVLKTVGTGVLRNRPHRQRP